jgi:hypothetical protein
MIFTGFSCFKYKINKIIGIKMTIKIPSDLGKPSMPQIKLTGEKIVTEKPLTHTTLTNEIIGDWQYSSGLIFTKQNPIIMIESVTITFTDPDGNSIPTYNTSSNFLSGKPNISNIFGNYEIYYSLNGKNPIRTKSYLYTGPFTLTYNRSGSDNTIVKVKAFKNGMASDIACVELRIVSGTFSTNSDSEPSPIEDSREQIMFTADDNTTIDYVVDGSHTDIEVFIDDTSQGYLEGTGFRQANLTAGQNIIFKTDSDFSSVNQFQIYDGEVSGDIDQFSDFTILWTLNTEKTNISGDISNLSGLSNIEILDFEETQVGGNISAFNNMYDLDSVNFLNAGVVTGDIASLVGSPSYVNFTGNDGIYGDISILSGVLGSYIYLNGTSVTGSLSSFAMSFIMYTLYLADTSVTGNLSDVPDSLTEIDISNTAISYEGIEDKTSIVYFKATDNEWSTVQVDACLEELIANNLSGSFREAEIDISGTNSPPSEEGLNNKNLLVAWGWTVTVSS